MPFADFEIKSLPGRFREFDAAIDRAQEAGTKPDGRVFKAVVTSVNTVLREARHTILTNLVFGGTDPNDVAPSYDESLALLQQIEREFLEQTNNPEGSPYLFGLTAADKDWNDD